MACCRVNVGRDDIRLHLVSGDVLRRAAVGERVEHLEEPERTIGILTQRCREHRPERRVRVLGAVLSHAR
jgi:hypothetical protein